MVTQRETWKGGLGEGLWGYRYYSFFLVQAIFLLLFVKFIELFASDMCTFMGAHPWCNADKYINSSQNIIYIYIYVHTYICTYIWEKAMVPHSSTLAWKIPWMEEPGRLQFAGLLRVKHD